MAITVHWDNEDHTILRYAYQAEWTWADLEDARVNASAMLAEVSHPVDTIIDVRHSSFLPRDMVMHRQDNQPTLQESSSSRLMVIVGANALVQATAKVVFSLCGEVCACNIAFRSTLPEAYTCLAQPALSPPA